MDRRLSNKCIQIKGPKLDPPDGTTFDFEEVHFWTLFGTWLLCTGAQNWTLKMLNPVPPGSAVLRSPQNLPKSRCPSPDLHQITQTSTEISNKGREQGRPQPRLQKSYPFLSLKTNPLRTSLAPACLNHYIFPGCYEIDEKV